MLGLLVLLCLPPVPSHAGSSPPQPCPDFAIVAFVGGVCARDSGLMELYSPDGRQFLGLTHGPDVAAGGAHGLPGAAPVPPVCVEDRARDHYGLLIYARPSDMPDGYTNRSADIRAAAMAANGRIAREAATFNVTASFKMACVDDQLEVRHEVLPTRASQAWFYSIVADLRQAGYTDSRIKHWVFYDDPSHHIPFRGQANMCDDDRRALDNAHNGATQADPRACAGPFFAIDYGEFSDFIILHEVGHVLGAVQSTTPHSSGGAHCNDGYDVMCYADGGRSSNYSSTACPEPAPFDCNHDDYFHPSPDPGSYLATHWNLASRLNRYVRIGDGSGAPVVERFRCADEASVAGFDRRCEVYASDDSSKLHYEIDWGDGTTSRHPPEGAAVPNERLNASHAFASNGSYATKVVAIDNGDPPRSSPPTLANLSLNQPPGAPRLRCLPDVVLRGDPLECRVAADDDSDGVQYTMMSPWSQRVPYAGFAAPGTERASWGISFSTPGDHVVSAFARDDASPSLQGPSSEIVVRVHNNTRPRQLSLDCVGTESLAGEPVRCAISAVDPDQHRLVYRLDWGDGSVEVFPALESGTIVNATHAFAAVGAYGISLSVLDEGSPAGDATLRRAPWPVVSNLMPVMRSLVCRPNPALVEEDMRCAFLATDDSEGVSYRLDWGDGSFEQIPEMPPGAEASGTHAFGAAGPRIVTVTPTDSEGRMGKKMGVGVSVSPRCDAEYEGELVLGLGGILLEGVSWQPLGRLPEGCQGRPYLFEASEGSEWVVCWGDGSCSPSESGKVPHSAWDLSVVLKAGVRATYRLTLGDAVPS